MTDKEMLELAAKAAGIEIGAHARFIGDHPGLYFHNDARNHPMCRKPNTPGNVEWNPLTDDGDALRLAVKLGLAVVPYPIFAWPKHSVIAKRYEHARYLRGESNDVDIEQIAIYGDDQGAATRLAITRAAAQIGSELK